jgi:hypothetical protein
VQNEKTQSYINSAGCVAQNLAAGQDLNLFGVNLPRRTIPPHKLDKTRSSLDNSTSFWTIQRVSGQFNELEREGRGLSGHKSDASGQQLDTSQHKKCAICVQRQDEMPDDLARVVAAWTTLTPDARSRIMEITDK